MLKSPGKKNINEASYMKIEDFGIEVFRRNVKHIRFSVFPAMGKITLVAPLRIDQAAIHGFVISRLPWLKKHLNGFEQLKKRAELEFISGEQHYFAGLEREAEAAG